MAYTDENKRRLLDKMKELGEVLIRQSGKFRDRDTSKGSQDDLFDEVRYVQRNLDDLYKDIAR